MAVRWNMVFRTSMTSSGTGNICPSSCFNFPSDPYSPLRAGRGGILQQFSPAITTVAEVFSIFSDELRDRLAAFSAVIRSPSNMEFFIDFSLTNKDADKVTISMSPRGSNGDYPIRCSYTFVNKNVTASASFMDIGQLLDWLVSQLKNG